MAARFASLLSLPLFALISCKSDLPSTQQQKPSAAPTEEAVRAANPQALADPALANKQAPPNYKARFITTKGNFTIAVTRDWAPNAADRFYNLVLIGYYNGVRFFRVLDGFMAQFGIHGDPAISAKWRVATIKDEPVVQGNKRGRITFAKGGPDSRTTQVFINFVDNQQLDGMGFPAFGEVIDGMSVVDSINKKNGERPNQGRIQMEGNGYLAKEFPDLDWIKEAVIVP